MRILFLIAVLGVTLGAAAQDYGDDYGYGDTGKSCAEWVSQLTGEAEALRVEEVSSLKARMKVEGSRRLKQQLKEKQADLKAAKSNLKVAKKALKSEKEADKAMKKAMKEGARLQQRKAKAQASLVKAQKKAAAAERKVAAAAQKLEAARQNLDKANADLDKAHSQVDGLRDSAGISQASARKAREQKAAARKMVRDHVMSRTGGKDGNAR